MREESCVGRDIALRCPRRRAQRQATLGDGRGACLANIRSALRFAPGGDIAARCPYPKKRGGKIFGQQ